MILIISCLIILNNASMGFPDSYGLYNSFITYGIIRCLFEYAIGIVTYLLLIQMKTLPRKHFNSLIQLAVLILFILIYGKFDYNKNNDFLAPFFFAALIFSLSCKNGILYTLTANRLGKFLGDISYSVYLLHPIWVAFMTKYYHMPVTTLPMILIYFSEVVFSAYLLHRFVEKPCLKGLNFSATLKE